MTITNFNQLYQQLNTQQQLAVNTIEGPVMVIAGPGSGKTQVLTLRIAQILLQQDVQPENILALTYTDAAAANMTTRLVSLIGDIGYRVRVHTIHAFCKQIIENNPEFFNWRYEQEILLDFDRKLILSEYQKKQQMLHLYNPSQPYVYFADILNLISQLKRELISPTELKAKIQTEQEYYNKLLTELDLLDAELEQNALQTGKKRFRRARIDGLSSTEVKKRIKANQRASELADFYQYYLDYNKNNHLYDFDDLIIKVLEALKKHSSLLQDLQEEILYFLVDEYQDSNKLQNELVELLASYWDEQANLFVVGDHHQSIFKFQGASIINSLEFLQRFPKAKLINLTTGYRCPQSIYDHAHQLISNNNLNNHIVFTHKGNFITNGPMKSHQPVKNQLSIVFNQYQTFDQEKLAIVTQIQKLINEKKVLPSQIAILCRKNKQVKEFSDLLHSYHIAHQASQATNVFEHHLINELILVWQAINQAPNEFKTETIVKIIGLPWVGKMLVTHAATHPSTNYLHNSTNSKYSPLFNSSFWLAQIAQFAYQLNKNQQSLKQFINLSESEQLKWLTTNQCNLQVLPIISVYFTWLTNNKLSVEQTTLTQWVSDFLQKSELINQLANRNDRLLVLNILNTFFQWIKQLNNKDHQLTLSKLLETIKQMQEMKEPLFTNFVFNNQQLLTISTVHKAKGLEWDYVFLPQLVEDIWKAQTERNKISLPDFYNKKIDQKEESLQENRRLFFVALTRIKNQGYCSFANQSHNNNKLKNHSLAQVVSEASLHTYLETSINHQYNKAQQEQMDYLEKQIIPIPKQNILNEEDKQIIQEIAATTVLTPVSLNKYLHSPSDFFYNNILRCPGSQSIEQTTGSAIHKVLETANQYWQANQIWPTYQSLSEQYKQLLKQATLSSVDYNKQLLTGLSYLEKYYNYFKNTQPNILATERSIKTVWNGIQLAGRIDRLDLDNQQIIVVDYKYSVYQTGKQIHTNQPTKDKQLSERERNLPPNLHGDKYRQLLFYKLLLQLENRYTQNINQGQLVFLKNQEQRKYAVTVELPDEDLDLLKELIIKVSKEIKNLEFLNTKSDWTNIY